MQILVSVDGGLEPLHDARVNRAQIRRRRRREAHCDGRGAEQIQDRPLRRVSDAGGEPMFARGGARREITAQTPEASFLGEKSAPAPYGRPRMAEDLLASWNSRRSANVGRSQGVR